MYCRKSSRWCLVNHDEEVFGIGYNDKFLLLGTQAEEL